MTRHPALSHLRIGCVQYLNSRPLIHACEGPVKFDHPSGLARDLAAGALDAALVPIFEVLRHPRYLVADGVAIASDGPVFSVFLAHRGLLQNVRTIALDPASLTSAHLLQVLLAEYHGLHPRCVDAAKCDTEPDARLLIGNQAIDFRLADGGRHELLDLGAEWQRCTGLPFVYAVWALRPDLANAPAVAADFRRLKCEGIPAIPAIIAADSVHPREVSLPYLTRHIRFDLGDRETAGIAKFAGLLADARFIPPLTQPLAFL
jgi:chorismate dehydratase